MLNEVRFVLSTPLKYPVNGIVRDASFITLRAPMASQIELVARIKQAVSRAFYEYESKSFGRAEASDETEPASSADDSQETARERGKQLILAIGASSVDLPGLFKAVESLFVQGVAVVDGEVKMTPFLLGEMTAADLEAMIGVYLATFPLAS